jgi:hypothetical protein
MTTEVKTDLDALINEDGGLDDPTTLQSDEEILGLDEDDYIPDKFKFVTRDNVTIEVLKDVAKLSVLVTAAIDQDEKADSMPFPSVNSTIMAYVIEYLEHHFKTGKMQLPKKPLPSKNFADAVEDPWDAEFVDKVLATSQQHLYDLILAANYMDIESLLRLCCARTACLLKGQPLEKFKGILDPQQSIQNDNEEDGVEDIPIEESD